MRPPSVHHHAGWLWEIAPQYGALVVFAEHRYYGLSLPFGNNSYDLPNLAYLSAEQVRVLDQLLRSGANRQRRRRSSAPHHVNDTTNSSKVPYISPFSIPIFASAGHSRLRVLDLVPEGQLLRAECASGPLRWQLRRHGRYAACVTCACHRCTLPPQASRLSTAVNSRRLSS